MCQELSLNYTHVLAICISYCKPTLSSFYRDTGNNNNNNNNNNSNFLAVILGDNSVSCLHQVAVF